MALLLRGIDQQDWSLVREQLAARVTTDYASLFGAPPSEVTADELVAQWTTLLTPLHATQHMLGAGSTDIDGGRATVHVPVRGYHVAQGLPGGDEWMVAGHYEAGFERADDQWRLRSLRLDVHHQTGNRNLLQEAGESDRALPEPDGVRIERVRFSSMGERVAGYLYRPATGEGPHPGVVVLGSWTTVKEQMAGRYAAELAKRGFAALAFDPRGYGESGGQPRNLESASMKMADVAAAVAFLRRDSRVATDSVGALGICAGAGFVAGAAVNAPGLGAVALVAPWLHDAGLVEAIYGGEAGVKERLDRAAAAQSHYDATGEVEYVPAVSTTDESAAMYGPFDYYLDAARGAVEAWPNAFATMAWTEWLTFDPHPFAAQQRAPLLMVHSEQAAIPEGARRFHGAVPKAEPIRWLEGTQFDFYDDPNTVGPAVDAVAEHLRAHLPG
ncbi:MAG: alpha/beta fold hydrolase [Myxococcota bacterium]